MAKNNKNTERTQLLSDALRDLKTGLEMMGDAFIRLEALFQADMDARFPPPPAQVLRITEGAISEEKLKM